MAGRKHSGQDIIYLTAQLGGSLIGRWRFFILTPHLWLQNIVTNLCWRQLTYFGFHLVRLSIYLACKSSEWVSSIAKHTVFFLPDNFRACSIWDRSWLGNHWSSGAGAPWWCQWDLNMVSHRYSVVFRSGEYGGQSLVSIPSSLMSCLDTLAAWGHCHAPGETQDLMHQWRVWQWV